MAINLLNIEPHKVSRDLSGYITFIYGAPKTGKTTLAAQMDGALILAFERGYSALPGVKAQDITSWNEMRQVYRELKKPEVKQVYKAVVVDTIDIASEMCSRYVCNQNDIESLGELDYGKGWTAFKEEFSEVFRGLTQLGYAVYFIGHAKEATIKDDNGIERLYIRPALSSSTRSIISGMADIYGYAHQKKGESMSVLTLRSSNDSIDCGGRFKYIASEIPMNYEALTKALTEAIDKEAKEHNNEFVTDEPIKPIEIATFDFEGLQKEFQDLVGQLMNINQSNGTKITTIVDKFLGKGKKVKEAKETQAEQLDLIIRELKALL